MIEYFLQNMWQVWAVIAIACLILELSSGDFFIICTVFYITLFIMVLQANRRKIQLLQSRLDNIHAMQKMAVIEPRQDVSQIFSSSVYLRIKQYLNEGRSIADEDWKELAEIVNDTIQAQVITSIVERRRAMIWYDYASCYYESLLQVANMMSFYQNHAAAFHTVGVNEVWKEYTTDFYKMDG